MSDLISRKALLEALQGQVSAVCNTIPYSKGTFTALHDRQMEIYDLIERQPTVDAVEVVCCNNCKHWDKDVYKDILTGFCECFETSTSYDEFCSSGMQRLKVI